MRRIITSLVGLAVTVTAVGGGAASASPGTAPGAPHAPAASAAAEHRRIVEYWTPERRATAIPRGLARPAPNARPGGGGVGTGW